MHIYIICYIIHLYVCYAYTSRVYAYMQYMLYTVNIYIYIEAAYRSASAPYGSVRRRGGSCLP